jgi:hypothetical protein
MAPEINGGTYEGPPADIFAMGIMLFLICQAEMPFTRANDDYYISLHEDP